MQALRLAVLGDQRQAEPARIARRADVDGLTVEPDLAAGPARSAEPNIVSRISVRPEPSSPPMPRISPA